MKLKYKKILAKEILVVVLLLIVSTIVYFVITLYDSHIRKYNTELSIKIENVSNEIQIKTDSLANLRSPLDLTGALKILKPWEKFDKNGKPKFDPNKEYEIHDEHGIDKKVNPKEDNLKRIVLKKQILKLDKQRKLFEDEVVNNIDLKDSLQKSIILLLILAYPIRFLILGTIWSFRILKKKED